MVNSWWASTMGSIMARTHQLVSEPLRSSAAMSSSDLEINHHPQQSWISSQHSQPDPWSFYSPVDPRILRQIETDHHPWQHPSDLQPHFANHSGHLQEKMKIKNSRDIDQDPQYFIQDSKYENSDSKKADLINRLPKNLRSEDQDPHLRRLDFYQSFRSEDLIDKPSSSPQDPNEGKTRGHDASIRDNMIRSNEDLEQNSQEPHTDFRSEVAVEKERGVSLWSMIEDNIGKDLTKVCLPVYLNEPLSSLQKSFEDIEYSYFIDQGYEWRKKDNDLLRMLNVSAFATSGSAPTEEKVSHQPTELLLRPRPPPQPPPKPPPESPLPKLQKKHPWPFIELVEDLSLNWWRTQQYQDGHWVH